VTSSLVEGGRAQNTTTRTCNDCSASKVNAKCLLMNAGPSCQWSQSDRPAPFKCLSKKYLALLNLSPYSFFPASSSVV